MADAGDDERLDLLADIGASLACTCQDLEDATPNFSDPGLTVADQQTCQRPRAIKTKSTHEFVFERASAGERCRLLLGSTVGPRICGLACHTKSLVESCIVLSLQSSLSRHFDYLSSIRLGAGSRRQLVDRRLSSSLCTPSMLCHFCLTPQITLQPEIWITTTQPDN